MTLFYYIGTSSDLGAQAVRLGDGFSFTEAAESGELSMSQIRIDDPAGSLNIPGHYPFRAIETGCSFDSLFRGYFADRTVKRADSYRTGAARVWDATVYDLNAALQFEVIRGNSAKRPAETDTERLAWLLASGYTGPISTDGSAVFGAGVNLDKQDYRGLTMADVLSDCAQVSGCNYFVAWDASLGAVLHYYLPTRAFFSSTLRISNVLTDVDGSTTFAPSMDSELSLDPSRVFSGVYLNYGDRMSAAAYETNPTVLAAIGHKRETQVLDASVNSASRASAKATKYLEEAETEQKTITCTLHKIPVASVNLIRAGQRIQVKFSHMPGFTSFTWLRISRRTVRQDGDDQLHYALTLTLVDPKQGGTQVRHKPGRHPDAAVTTDGTVISLTQRECRHLFDGFDQDPIATIAYDNPTNKSIGSLIFHNLPYTTTGCPLGPGGWSGQATYETWWEYTTGALADNVVGVRFTVSAANLTFAFGAYDQAYFYGWLDQAPTDVGQYVPIGLIDWVDGGAVVDVPRSAINEGGTSYFCIAPGWACADAFYCAQDLVDGVHGPAGATTSGGEGNSGKVRAPTVTATYLVIDGTSGLAPWTAGDGVIDGANATFSLTGWDGTGTPLVKVNGLLLDGTDYDADSDALTVTLRVAPQEGDNVTFRYQLGA